MKIFVIPTWYPTDDNPTFANWVLPHIDCLKKRHQDVKVIYLNQVTSLPDNIFEIKQSGNSLLSSSIKMPFYWIRFRNIVAYYFYFSHYLKKLEKLFEHANEIWGLPDIIHSHVSILGGHGALIIGKKYNIPVVITEHYTGYTSDARYFWRLYFALKRIGKMVDSFYAVSPGFLNRIEKTKTIRVTGVLPNPIDVNKFTIRTSKGKSDIFNIVSTGIGYRKGTDILLTAMEQIGNLMQWKLKLYGSISEIDLFNRSLKKPRLIHNLEVLNRVSQEELAQVFQKADVYVVASRFETANVAMLQAIACGTPVVTTKCGGPETLIDESVGIIVDKEYPEQLAQAIIEIWRNKKKYEKENLRDFVVKRYSEEVVADQMVREYTKTIESYQMK